VRVLSRLFRRLFLDGLMELYRTGQLAFFGDLEGLAAADTFKAWLTPFRKAEWVARRRCFSARRADLSCHLRSVSGRIAVTQMTVALEGCGSQLRWP
jgi:hypothetical protein